MDTVRLLYLLTSAPVTRLTILGQDSQDGFEGDKHQREGRRREHWWSPGDVRSNTGTFPADACKSSRSGEENACARPKIPSCRDRGTPRSRLRKRYVHA